MAVCGCSDRQKDIQKDIQTDRQTDRQKDGQTYRQTNRQTDRLEACTWSQNMSNNLTLTLNVFVDVHGVLRLSLTIFTLETSLLDFSTTASVVLLLIRFLDFLFAVSFPFHLSWSFDVFKFYFHSPIWFSIILISHVFC